MRSRYINLLVQVIAPTVHIDPERIRQELSQLSDAQLDNLLEKKDEEIALLFNKNLV